MGYSFYNIREGAYNHRSITGRLLVLATALLFAVSIGLSMRANAAVGEVVYEDVPFTTEESAKWTTDRAEPSGEATVVSYADRDDVLAVSINSENADSRGGFYATEGLLREVDAADGVKVDLYVDGDWQNKDVRAGFWGVGADDAGDRTEYFPIIEFTNTDSFQGWRVWDSTIGWINLEDEDQSFNWNEWYTLEIVLNEDESSFDLFINDELVKSVAADGSTNIGSVIVNSYNYGEGSESYVAHWSNFAIGQFVADSTAPDVSITNPVDDAVVSGEVEFRGTIVEDNLLRYYYVLRDESGAKVLDKTVTTDTVLDNDVFLTLDTTELTENATYTLRLEARDDAGNKDSGSVDTISFTVNNVPDNKEQCKNDGWVLFGTFKNQGQCVASVVSNENSAVHGRN